MSKMEYYKKYEPIFGSWYITEEIGKGSFGVVYKIEQPSNGYKSAMKAITIPSDKNQIIQYRNQGMDDASITSYYSSAKDDLVNEFRLMELMKGETNIVSYEDQLVIPHDDIGWDILVRMELLTELSVYVANNGFTISDLINLGIDMCNALEICEGYSIVHRDIKPANIFVSNRGKYKLGDFGIAKTVEKTTGGLSKKGTYNFMAPEVYLSKAYGPSVDLYSLGLVLYYYANSRRTPFLPPFPQGYSPSDDEQALTRRIRGERLPVLKSVPAELSEIILKACEFNSHDRYKNSNELKNALIACRDSIIADGVDMNVNLCPDFKSFINADNGGELTRGALFSAELESKKRQKEKQKREEAARLAETEKMYSDAVRILSSATTEAEYQTVADQLTLLSGYKDADELVKRCNNKIIRIKAEAEKKIADMKRKEEEYMSAMAAFNCAVSVEDYSSVRERFAELNGFMDSSDFTEKCDAAAKSILLELEKEAKRKAEAERLAKLEVKYNQATAKLENADAAFASGQYLKAVPVYTEIGALFDELSGYKDSVKKNNECKQKILKAEGEIKRQKEEKERLENKYLASITLMQNSKYSFESELYEVSIWGYKEAVDSFAGISEYKDVNAKIVECNSMILAAEKEIERQKAESEAKRIARLKEKYSEAEVCLSKAEKNYKSQNYAEAISSYYKAEKLFSEISDYNDSSTKAKECLSKADNADKALKKQIEEEKRLARQGKNYTSACNNIQEAETARMSMKFNEAVDLYRKANELFVAIEGYRDSNLKSKQCLDKLKIIDTEWNAYKEEQRKKREAARKKRKRICLITMAAIVMGLILFKIIHVPSYDFPALTGQIVMSPNEAFDAYEGCSADETDYSAFTLSSDNEAVAAVDGSVITANTEGVATITLVQDFGGNKVRTSEHRIFVLERETDFDGCRFSDNKDGSYKISGAEFSGTLFYVDGAVYIQDDMYELNAKDAKRFNRFAEDNELSIESIAIGISSEGKKYIVYPTDDGYKVQKLSKIELIYGKWSKWTSSLPSDVSNGADYDVQEKYQCSKLIMITDYVSADGCDSKAEAISDATAMLPSGVSADSPSTYQDGDGFWGARITYSYYSDSWGEWTDCSSLGQDTSTVKYKTLFRYRTIS